MLCYVFGEKFYQSISVQMIDYFKNIFSNVNIFAAESLTS